MANTVKYYLSKGFDLKTAEYFANGKKRITGVVPNNDFTLTISFDNGEKRLYDMRPLLKKGTVFEPFIKLENFRRVYVDDTHCIAWDIDPNIDSNKVWSNKVDLCPDGCYIDSVPVGGALLRQSLRVGGLPFDVRMEQPNKETMAAMLEAERIARDPSVKRYTDVEEALGVLKE